MGAGFSARCATGACGRGDCPWRWKHRAVAVAERARSMGQRALAHPHRGVSGCHALTLNWITFRGWPMCRFTDPQGENFTVATSIVGSRTLAGEPSPQNSSSVCQSRPLRARREASIEITTPTRPSQIAARSFSNPGRLTPEPERPRSSSMTLILAHPSCRARSTSPYRRRRLSPLLIT